LSAETWEIAESQASTRSSYNFSKENQPRQSAKWGVEPKRDVNDAVSRYQKVLSPKKEVGFDGEFGPQNRV
jgi:hypothetical protein